MGKKQWHELRVREQVGPEKYRKISKFYFVRGAPEAVAIYRKHARNPYTVMRCTKNGFFSPEHLASQAARLFKELKREERTRPATAGLGVVGGFLGLGDELLKDLRKGGRKRNRG